MISGYLWKNPCNHVSGPWSPALNHAVPRSISSLCTRYTSFHRLAKHTRPRTCFKYVPKQSIAWHFEHVRHHRFGHVSSMYRSSRLRSTLNTNVITGLDMFQVCTEAVDCLALETRMSSQVWTCFKYVPKQSNAQHFFSQVWTCVTSLTKTKTLLPVKRMLSLGPWPRVLPKPYETMFIMHKNKRLLWGVHGQKRARPRTRKV